MHKDRDTLMQQERSKTLVQKHRAHLQECGALWRKCRARLQDISNHQVPYIRSKELYTHV